MMTATEKAQLRQLLVSHRPALVLHELDHILGELMHECRQCNALLSAAVWEEPRQAIRNACEVACVAQHAAGDPVDLNIQRS